MKKQILSIGLIIISLVLMMVPYSVVLIFSPSPNDIRRFYTSYFSLKPIAYANLVPATIVILTIITLVVLIITTKFSKNSILTAVLPIVSAFVAIIKWIDDSRRFTWISLIIVLLHITVGILQIIYRISKNKEALYITT